MAAGVNEAAVWGLPEAGECLKCFRTVPLEASRQPLAPLPSFAVVDIPRHPHRPVARALGEALTSNTSHKASSGNAFLLNEYRFERKMSA